MISFIKQDIKSTITPPSIVYLFNNIIIYYQSIQSKTEQELVLFCATIKIS